MVSRFSRYTSWKTKPRLKRFRIVKYKQRSQILTRPNLAVLENVQIGGCTGLSFGWIRRTRAAPHETPAQRLGYLDTDQSWRVIDVFAKYFNEQWGPNYAARVTRTSLHGCGLSYQSGVTETNFLTYGTALPHIRANDGFHVLVLRFLELGPSHVCALYADTQGMRFFDPNSGEYYVGTNDQLEFFRALTEQYADYVAPNGVQASKTFSSVEVHHLG